MAKYLTTTAAHVVSVNAGKEVMVRGVGTWDGASLDIAIKNGFGAYVTEANNGTKSANFDYVYTIGEEDGIQFTLSSVGGSTNVAVSVKELQR